jgi:hypothetical protein
MFNYRIKLKFNSKIYIKIMRCKIVRAAHVTQYYEVKIVRAAYVAQYYEINQK